MDIQSEKREQGTLLTVKGRMDSSTASTFDAHCQQLVDSGETVVITDLTDLEFMSSAGLRSILVLAKKLKSVDGTMCFCGVEGMIKEIFTLSGFDNMFTFYDTAEEAFNA